MGHFIMFTPQVDMLDGYWAKQSSEKWRASWTAYFKVIKMHEYRSLQGIKSIPTYAFATSIQINHFCNFRYDCPS